LTTALERNPSNSQDAICLYYVRARVGQRDPKELANLGTRVDRLKWPGAVIDLYLGFVDPESIKAATLAGADRNQACELHFYLATFDLLKDMQDEARRDLEDALHNCPLAVWRSRPPRQS
jgi:hypothetical protein